VPALFFLIADVFSHRVFHYTGFNKVGGEAELMVVVFAFGKFGKFGKSQCKKRGCVGKLLSAGDTALLLLKIARSPFSFESLHKYREREREKKIETERDDLIVDG